MRRSSALVLALLAVLLVGAQTPALAAHKRRPRVSVFLEFHLPKRHGFSVEVFSIGEKIILQVAKGQRSNQYEVPAFISEHRLKARLGALGRINLRFRPTHIDPAGLPSKGCHGCPLRTDRGIFSGTIHFVGENDFLQLDASRVRGRVEVSERVPGGEGPFVPEEEPGEFTGLIVQSEKEEFLAFAVRRPGEEGPVTFLAGAEEQEGAMRIVRGGGAEGSASTFLVDPRSGTATVQPPFPFSGSATLARNPDGSQSWTGSLSLDLLGVGPASLIFPTFKARIAQNVSFP